MKKFTVNDKTNLKDFTDSVYPQGSFCLTALLKNKDVKVNGVRINSSVSLKFGDEVVYYTTSKQEGALSHTVIFEDENVLIADKFSGVSSEGLLSELKEKGGYSAVHRLDRNTQGLIVFAKNKTAEEELFEGFKQRNIHKTYIALCKNSFKKSEDKLTLYMQKQGDIMKVYSAPAKGMLTAVTAYRVKEYMGDIALVEIQLFTGRTHQIRAVTAFSGFPVLGDEKYGDRALNAKYGAKRQRLIAKRISFSLSGELAYLSDRVFESNFAF